jgi:cystathionine gamma-lyase/homocysteine desulfhydrase
MKTLGIRMEEHELNTKKIAAFLKVHPSVNKVYYPGLETHPQHEVAKEQMRGFGGMVSFEVKNDKKVNEILSKVKYFTLAESLGAVESLISVPAKMTHASIPEERREKLGISDRLIRLSIGLEDIEDLLEDLQQSLADE